MNSHFFVTGSTGAIGSALIPLLLEDPCTRVTLLLRADSDAHQLMRLSELARFWEVEEEPAPFNGRLQAVIGDVCRPRLGLDERTYARLTAEATHFISAAGNVRLNQTLGAARHDAIQSAQSALQFVRDALSRGPFQKLDYLSTVGVAGRSSGVIPEEPLGCLRQFRNTYEQAKAEAEEIVLAEIGAGLPATVLRPSMVVGDSRTGRIIHFQVFYHLIELFSGRRFRGITPEPGRFRLDIIPVDYAARAICMSCRRADAIGRIFHLCSGPRRALSLSEIAARVRSLLADEGQPLPPLHPLQPILFRCLLPIVRAFVSAKSQRALGALPYLLDYLEGDQSFDNSRTDEFFSQCGLRVPEAEEYLGALVRFYCRQRKR